MHQLKTIVTMFLDKITSSIDLLPFCITYMARVLHRSLTSKFPYTPEKDILKVHPRLLSCSSLLDQCRCVDRISYALLRAACLAFFDFFNST